MWTLTGGPLVKFTDTSLHDNKGKFIATYETPLYGTEAFGQIGGGGELVYDARDNSGHTRRGVRFRLSGELYPKLWDVESTFGYVAGDASAYLSANVPTLPTLALRVGGKNHPRRVSVPRSRRGRRPRQPAGLPRGSLRWRVRPLRERRVPGAADSTPVPVSG